MNLSRLIRKNIFLYKPFYRLIAVAVVVAVAVIVGSLVVGDSVRGTLLQRVDERLGNTETIIFSRQSFMHESIIDPLRHSREGGNLIADGLRVKPAMTTRGILLMDGFVSVSGRLIPVMVWGVDDLDIEKGQAKINRALHNEIASASLNNRASPAQSIVLRLPAAGIVPSGSMTPTIRPGDRLFVEKVTYHFTGVSPGDIVVFQPPEASGYTDDLIKRLIGTEGDTVEIKDGMLYVNDCLIEESYVTNLINYDMAKIVIPKGKAFMLGDNRNYSVDSHVWGFADVSSIKGKALLIYWPINRFRIIWGQSLTLADS